MTDEPAGKCHATCANRHRRPATHAKAVLVDLRSRHAPPPGDHSKRASAWKPDRTAGREAIRPRAAAAGEAFVRACRRRRARCGESGGARCWTCSTTSTARSRSSLFPAGPRRRPGSCSCAGRGPHDGVSVLVVNAVPRDLDPERVRKVSRLLHGHGIEAFAAVAGSGAVRSLLFGRPAVTAGPGQAPRVWPAWLSRPPPEAGRCSDRTGRRPAAGADSRPETAMLDSDRTDGVSAELS